MVLNSRFMKRLLIIYLSFTVIFTIFYILSCTFRVIPVGEAMEYVLAFASPFIYSGLCIIALMAYTSERTLKNNEKENIYNLGKSMHFFNFSMFESRVRYLERKHRKKGDCYMVAFTVAQANITQTFGRNKIITAFLGEVASFVSGYFLSGENLTVDDASFCFYHGMFILYIHCDDAKLREIVSVFNESIFQIAAEKDYRLYVQPFFGAAKIDRNKETFKMSVDNAIATRALSERRFERLTFYNPADVKTITVSETEEITAALEAKEFVVFYQPKFSLKKKEFVSCEALVRWDSKNYGLLPPSKFIEKAEAAGLIHEIDEYVFEKVCADLGEMRKKGRRVLPVSVNFSMYEFFDAAFVDKMLASCKRHNIPNHLIEIEVTESASQSNSFMAKLIIQKLQDKGFRVLMDDFGTGFSNIENLMKFNFDAIKLDRSYIIRIVNDAKAKAVVKLLIDLARLNDMEVIAEGVDNQKQVEILRYSGCDTIQGFFYSRPLPKNEYEKFISKGGNDFEVRREVKK